MSDLCSIHITKECHEILQNLSKKYNLDMRKLANFCILEATKKMQQDPTNLLNFLIQEVHVQQPTQREIIDALFDRMLLQEGRDFVWQAEIYKVVNPKRLAEVLEIEKLGYKKYFPDQKLILAWKKN